MGEPDNALRTYMRKPERVRSVLEYYLGEKLSEDWTIEREEEFHAVRNADGKVSFRQRDGMKRIRAGNTVFLLGLENQNTVNLIFPLRLMEMDCLTYRDGVEMIQERNQREKVRYGKRDERKIPDEELMKMDSDLKYVLGLMKCAGSRKKYIEYINQNREFFSRIPQSALDVIDVCSGIGGIRERLEFKMNEASGEEEADMCKAVRDIEKYAESKGMREGIRQGMKQGKKQGMELGSLKTLSSLVNDGILQISEAAGRMNLSEAAFKKKMKAAKYDL